MTAAAHRDAAPAPSGAEAALVVDQLACQRGDRLLFAGLDLRVLPGQVVWLRGANGRGKTSLLRLLTGLAAPARGQVLWQGRPLRSAGAEFRQRLVYIGHANGLKEDLTVLESLRFLARIHGRPATPLALTAALAELGMASRRDAPVRTLSQGQRRRVALARLALDLETEGPASLWALDEPYDALDVDGIASLDGLLSTQAARGGSVVLTSHLPVGLKRPLPTVLQLDALAPAPRAGRSEPTFSGRPA